MNLDKKRTFIVNTLYFGIMLLLAVVLLKYALPLLAPFVIGFVLAYLLKRPIRFASHKLHISRKAAAIALVLVFYCTIGLLLALLGIKAFSAAGDFLRGLPGFYTARVEPVLMSIFSGIEQSVLSIDESLIASLEQLWGQFVESLGQLVSSLSATVVGIAVSFIGLESLPTQYDSYTPGMNWVVIVLFCIIPMVAWAATLIAMKGYTLTGEKMKEIQAANARRRNAVANGMKLEEAMTKWQSMDQLPAEYRS